MTVILYGKADCGKCEAAKEKLSLLGVEYEVRDLAEAVAATSEWRDDMDERLSVMAAAQFYGPYAVPLVSVDGEVMTYPLAMLTLKGTRNGC